MTPEQAIEILARQILAENSDPTNHSRVEWEDFPDVGETDWEMIIEKLKSIAPPYPDALEVEEAYKLLDSRAEKTA